MTLADAALDYVTLVLAAGRHDPDLVDAYHGPKAWRAVAEAGEPRPLASLRAEAARLLDRVRQAPEGEPRLRRDYLEGQLTALGVRLAHLEGERLPFADEAEALYQVRPEPVPESVFQDALRRLDGLLDGTGALEERHQRLREHVLVPTLKVDAVFQAAIAEARDRTRHRLVLPDGEHFRLEYVTDRPWSAYNWYQGGGHSLIQVNLDQPMSLDRALDLAAHEGYPGHHVYNALLEAHYAAEPPAGRGWVECAIYPLFSPQSLIAEGTANFGIEVAFPGDDKLAFEREVLGPLAGLEAEAVTQWSRVQAQLKVLAFADNEAARGYLDGHLSREAAEAYLVTYSLRTPSQAAQRVRFIDTYRSYVVNYNLGEALVRDWVARNGGTPDQPDRRWAVFIDLISSPRLPRGLGLQPTGGLN